MAEKMAIWDKIKGNTSPPILSHRTKNIGFKLHPYIFGSNI
jgi:hypothetical protein